MTQEIVQIDQSDDDLAQRSRSEVEEAARKWFGVATDMRDQRDAIAHDLELALNICRSYREALDKLNVPDPHIVDTRNLLHKYGMDVHPRQSFRIFVDGVDITEHPDSLPGDAEELHLTAAEYYGTETAELVRNDETGEFGLIQKSVTTIEDDEEDDEDAVVVEPHGDD